MDYSTNFPDGFTGKTDPEEHTYKVYLSGSVEVTAYSLEEAREIAKSDLLFKVDELEIEDVEIN